MEDQRGQKLVQIDEVVQLVSLDSGIFTFLPIRQSRKCRQMMCGKKQPQPHELFSGVHFGNS
jgi:hypothetical protein